MRTLFYQRNNPPTDNLIRRRTAVIDVLSDVYAVADSGQVTLLGMLDQSSAFDVVDHQILFERLGHTFGLTGKVMVWIKSYLSSRSMYVYFNGNASSVISIACGLPQGSVLGPLFFLLYTAPLLPLIEKHGFKVYAYADDLQIYDHVHSTSASALVARFSDCVGAVKSWMASNGLRLNPSKMEMIWLGSTGQLRNCPMIHTLLISGVWITPSSKVRNLGVIIDDALTMSAHVNKLVSTCFFQLRQLRMVRRSLDVDAAHALVRALIHSRLDYCNGVLAGLPLYMFERLQSVLNAAARLVLVLPGRRKCVDPNAKQVTLAWVSTACHVQTVRPFLQMPARTGTRISIQTVRTYHRHSRPCASQVCVGRSACGAIYEQKNTW